MKTLRARLVFSYSFMVTLTITITLLTGFFLVRSQLLSGTDFLLEAEFKEIEARVSQLKPPASASEIEQAIGQHTMIDAPFFFFQVRNPSGEILFRSANLGAKALPNNLSRATVHLEDLGLLRVREFASGEVHLQVASNLNYLEALSNRFFRGLILIVPAVLISSFGVGFFLCEITLRPLRAIEQTARRISVSNLKERIPNPGTRDEIARLAELLNAMFDRLEQSFERIKQFTADFSHELRTPLSMIALHAEKVLKKPALDADSTNALMELLSETRRLNQIIDQLLTLAKAEAQTLPLNLSAHSTAEFLKDFEEDATALAEASGKSFILRSNEEITVVFDASWIRQVLFNLLSNAIKFSPAAGIIEVASRREGSFWRISFADNGPGIPDDQLEAIFDRFKQIRRSPDDAQGSGLGLAVSKSIIELHRGTIHCKNRAGQTGAQIVISLPLTSLAKAG